MEAFTPNVGRRTRVMGSMGCVSIDSHLMGFAAESRRDGTVEPIRM